MRRAAAVAAFTVLAIAPASAGAASWPDTASGRTEVKAVIDALNGALLASSSATATLEAWCADHHMAQPPRILAERVRGVDSPVTDEQRAELQVGRDEPIKFRRVRLTCGDHVLSEADNWYAPARLTPEMNRILETTDTPFGRVVAPLHPTRRTLAVERLWSPSPSRDSARRLAAPHALFRHRALVYDAGHRPIAEVIETYTAALLDYRR
jgi:chorismate-pyruvate lyase